MSFHLHCVGKDWFKYTFSTVYGLVVPSFTEFVFSELSFTVLGNIPFSSLIPGWKAAEVTRCLYFQETFPLKNLIPINLGDPLDGYSSL